MAALRLRAGGSIFVRTGNHVNGVDRTVPEIGDWRLEAHGGMQLCIYKANMIVWNVALIY